MTIAQELQSLTPSARLVLFVVDGTAIGMPTVLRFHNGTNALSQAVVWQGQTYQYIPVEARGFELRGDGPRPRPSLVVGDVDGVLAAQLRLYGDLSGAKLIRKQTHARYLDAVNFPFGVNAEADPTAAHVDELWIFDRVKSRDGWHVHWELVSPLDLEDVMLPARQVSNSICGSVYRSSECGYTGGPVAQVDDTATSNPLLDDCSRRVSGCKLRFGATAELPIDFFPGAGLIRSL
ncbi:MAG: phage minor tail protein L [Rubrivivax sp.]|nr:phage minor tail protein L [Rubrivivax sp.]